ncbi:MAG: hypothetical protein KatS3mg005_3417 [Bryobacteraceae bacterium]|jgi:hypothetical protein|nr:MAG: hypothetical protein KatS3mg005_3417 [Bryobacteraceae bacterium]
MAALLTSLSPTPARPGEWLTLSGSGFLPGVRVDYRAANVSASDTNPQLVSSSELRSIVPDLFQGMSGQLLVSVLNPGDDPTNELALDIAANPDVAQTFPLVSLGQLKSALGLRLDDESQDDRFRQLILLASAAIAGYCEREFRVLEYAESYDGDGTSVLRLRHTPIIEVLALSIFGQLVPVSEVKVTPEFLQFEDAGSYEARIRAMARYFPAGVQNIQVSYRAGYEQVPAEIAQACILQVSYLMNTLAKQGVANEGNTTAGVQTAFQQGLLAPAARVLANRYRRPKVLAP